MLYRAHRYTAHNRDQDYALHHARRDYGTELTARTVLCCSTHTQKGATHMRCVSSESTNTRMCRRRAARLTLSGAWP